MRDLFLTVLEISLSTGLVIAGLLVLAPVLNSRYAAKWKYAIWLLLALRLAVPFKLSLPKQSIVLDVPARITAPIAPAATAQTVTFTAGHTAQALSRVSALDVIAAIWLAGAAVYLLIHLLSYRHYRRSTLVNGVRVTDISLLRQIRSISRELGIRQRIPVIRDKRVGSPMVLGFFRPMLVLPEQDYGEAELYFVLKHELIHLKRRDVFGKLLFVIAGAVHWFNPLIHMMQKEAVVDMELSCDERVIQGLVFEFRKAYTETLLATLCRQSTKSTALSTQFYGGKDIMKKRFQNILHRVKKRNGMALLVLTLTAALVPGMVTGCSVSADTRSDPQQILDLAMEFGRAFNEGDRDAMKACMAENYQGSLSNAGPEGPIHFTGCRNAAQPGDTEIQEEKPAPVGSTYHVTAKDLSVPESETQEGLILALLKTEQGWKITDYRYERTWIMEEGPDYVIGGGVTVRDDPTTPSVSEEGIEDIAALDEVATDFAFDYFSGNRKGLDDYLVQPYEFEKDVYTDYYSEPFTGQATVIWAKEDAPFREGDVVPVSFRFTDPESGDSYLYLSLEMLKTAEGWKVQFYGLEK